MQGYGGTVNIKGLDTAVAQISALTTAVTTLQASLSGFAQKQQQLTTSMSNTFGAITSGANQATQSVNNLKSSVQSTSGGGFISSLFGTASAAAGTDIVKDLAMFPLRYITQTVGDNRQLGMNISAALGSQMYATGTSAQMMSKTLSRFPGNVQGTPEDLINLLGIARQAGAMVDMGAAGTGAYQGNSRSVGFLEAVSQAQKMSPATPVSEIAGTIGSYVANTSAQQQSMQLTGGAFSMIGSGGQINNIQKWAESILRWFEQQRPAPDTGKPFNYGQLMAQYFVGSNIDAWFNANGVPEGMKEYWWNYALAKTKTGSNNSQTTGFSIIPANSLRGSGGNQAWERLQSVSAQSRGQLQLAGTMAGTYSNKEQSNRWFNDLIGQAQNQIIPSQVAGGSLGALQYMPDALEQLLLGLLERGGTLGTIIGGGLGYGLNGIQSLVSNLVGAGGMLQSGLPEGLVTDASMSSQFDSLLGQFRAGGGLAEALSGVISQLGDVGDVGDTYGPMGAKSTAGMHPDMRRKVGAMMRANPKLQINSGLRDTVLQQNLKSKGHNRVSGKPSDHTRGWAADLGPRSQYGWIVNNAKKFGLSSGAAHGEPWHVGLGDTPDTSGAGGGTVDYSNEGSGLGALFGLLKGSLGKDDMLTSIGGIVPSLMTLFFGLFGMADNTDMSTLAFDDKIFEQLRSRGTYRVGGVQGPDASQNTYGSSFVGRLLQRVNNAANGSQGDETRTGSLTLEGALTALGLTSTGLSPGAMVAKIARYAGFTGENLTQAVAIAQRESSFNPGAHNTNRNTGDNSYGLTQINMLGSLGPDRQRQFGISSYDELFDPLVNMRAMYTLSGGTNFQPWTGYRAGLTLSQERLADARDYIHEAGLGDIDTFAARYPQDMSRPTVPTINLASSNPSTSVVFQNSFVINPGSYSVPNSGMDARRTAAVLADHLESEMRQRLARSN